MDAAAAGARERAPLQLSALPLSCLLLILARVPVDTRLRCAEVCRAWRAAVADPSVWRRVDLSLQGGVFRVTEALLRAAVARARGSLQALDVPGRREISHAALFAAIAANAASLVSLCVRGVQNLDDTLALLGAAPALRHFDADVDCQLPRDLQQACAALRNEPPFERLRVHTLQVCLWWSDEDGNNVVEASAADVLQLASAISLHQPLVDLHLEGSNQDDTPLAAPAVLDAVVSAALSCRRLSCMRMFNCYLSPVSAPALARLLSSNALTELEVYNDEPVRLFDADAAVLVARALRANATLTLLKLDDVAFWADMTAAETLLDALRGHVSLRVLNLTSNAMEVAASKRAGFALAKLVAANSRALRSLLFGYSRADETCCNPVFQALPYNTHLRTLQCRHRDKRTQMSEAFARAVVLPTVRANTSLEELNVAADDTPAESALCAAEVLVADR
jgi:hypothetical protein